MNKYTHALSVLENAITDVMKDKVTEIAIGLLKELIKEHEEHTVEMRVYKKLYEETADRMVESHRVLKEYKDVIEAVESIFVNRIQ